ncbi:MAG: hypothetical protein M3461_13845 [Pseudomonadota bacterium]|nr:hypothetical protein [Pseudomonadota bacterium]
MPYLFGDSPTSFDAVAYGFLVNLLLPPIESPLKDHALALANLPPYCARIREQLLRGAPRIDVRTSRRATPARRHGPVTSAGVIRAWFRHDRGMGRRGIRLYPAI